MNQTPQTEDLFASTPGEWLQHARLKADITIEQMAKELNLDVRKIEAIEANKFVELGAPVFVKGYLRKYARLVTVPEAVLLQRYDSFGGAAPEVVPVPVSHGMIPEQRPVVPRWVWILMWVLIGLAGAVTLLSMRTASKETTTTTVPAQQIETETTQLQSSPLESIPVGSTASSESSAAGLIALNFRFSADSWVEVYDANNQQILYEMVAAGNARTINAQPPLRVTLGSATAVALQINSKPVTVTADHIDASVARFVVNAAGVIE